ncbi:MAG: hypothetical protein LC722_08505, partial [Actinobacteria bacterium]|nr:hypothetical protein [Actinomycetota bacterium]
MARSTGPRSGLVTVMTMRYALTSMGRVVRVVVPSKVAARAEVGISPAAERAASAAASTARPR